MPGVIYDMNLTEALAVIAMAGDDAFAPFASASERAMLHAEAMRVVEHHAAVAAQRNLPSNVERLARCETRGHGDAAADE